MRNTNGSMGTAAAPARERNAAERSRAERVAELREQYRKGVYRVDANAVAAAIVDAHLNLLTLPPRQT